MNLRAYKDSDLLSQIKAFVQSERDAQKVLIKLQPQAALPRERERLISESASEVKFVMNDKLKAKLEEVRSLMGPRAASMSYAELFDAMSDLSLDALKAKRFGKKRIAQTAQAKPSLVKKTALLATSQVTPKNNPRYVSQEVKYSVWNRDQGRCTNCQSSKLINYDHIIPVACGGQSTLENIRLLCFHCNQRASTKIFGKIYERQSLMI